MQLDIRAQTLLKALVERYIADGQPVGSRALSKISGLELSPATIRNIMSDLEELGLVASPHTSAGRIPTIKAFRAYVDSLPTRRLGASELLRVRSELRQADSVGERLEKTSHLLTEMTRNVGIAAATAALCKSALSKIRVPRARRCGRWSRTQM